MTPLLNEVVLRFTAFGLSGAHVKRMVVETDSLSGRTVERIGPPEPVHGFAALEDVLGQALVAAIQANNELQAQVADLTAQLEAATQPTGEPSEA